MSLVNNTHFSAASFQQYDLNKELFGFVAVRGTFIPVPEKRLVPAEIMTRFLWEDEYEGDPDTTSLLRQGDFVPWKLGTDVTFLGSSYAPGGLPQRSWKCGIKVANRLEKVLVVHGPRWWTPYWTPRWSTGKHRLFKGWELSEAEPVTSVELSWKAAFGGPRPCKPDETAPADINPDNPLGCGWLDFEHSPRDQPIAAPRIEADVDPILDWRRIDYMPQGFAPIPPWWRPRQRYMGTIDDAWERERHPFLPLDFNQMFWQCAHPDCIIKPWVNGNEAVQFLNLHPDHGLLRVFLPRIALRGTLKRSGEDDLLFQLHLDGIHADFRARREKRIHLTWRGWFPWSDDEGDIELNYVNGE